MRKLYLFALRLTASSWARKNLGGSVKRFLRPNTRSSTDRLTKTALHPFDKEYGTDTSGEVVFHELQSGSMIDAYATGYLGSEPSVLRHILPQIPFGKEATFVDLGCGKGRATIVASEFDFHRIIGVELSPMLASVAESNATLIGSKFPNRPKINIVQGDAASFEIPHGLSVIYMYHPFERIILKQVIRNCRRAIQHGNRELFIIYERPIHGSVIDKSPSFGRYLAEMVPLDDLELPFSEEVSAAVIVWKGPKHKGKDENGSALADAKIHVEGLSVTLRSKLR